MISTGEVSWHILIDNLNCIRIEPRTGEKLSFNVDIHVEAATFIHARAFMHFIQWDEM